MKKENKDNKLEDQIKGLTDKIKWLEKTVKTFEGKTETLNKSIKRVSLNLRAYMDRKTSEIRVVEDDGTWGDYTGVFYADPEDEKRLVLGKARKHYEEHFETGVWYHKKTLGLFLNSVEGKELVEVLKDTGNEVIEGIEE